jgi:hypothetical protein
MVKHTGFKSLRLQNSRSVQIEVKLLETGALKKQGIEDK